MCLVLFLCTLDNICSDGSPSVKPKGLDLELWPDPGSICRILCQSLCLKSNSPKSHMLDGII